MRGVAVDHLHPVADAVSVEVGPGGRRQLGVGLDAPHHAGPGPRREEGQHTRAGAEIDHPHPGLDDERDRLGEGRHPALVGEHVVVVMERDELPQHRGFVRSPSDEHTGSNSASPKTTGLCAWRPV